MRGRRGAQAHCRRHTSHGVEVVEGGAFVEGGEKADAAAIHAAGRGDAEHLNGLHVAGNGAVDELGAHGVPRVGLHGDVGARVLLKEGVGAVHEAGQPDAARPELERAVGEPAVVCPAHVEHEAHDALGGGPGADAALHRHLQPQGVLLVRGRLLVQEGALGEGGAGGLVDVGVRRVGQDAVASRPDAGVHGISLHARPPVHVQHVPEGLLNK